jgi:hypothetical protein
MCLKDITAIPHPDGNRIDLHWINPDPVNYPGVCIVRRMGTHPISPQDGVIVAEGDNLEYTIDDGGERCYTVPDSPLQGETVYYYAWFPYAGDQPDNAAPDPANRAAAMVTSPYGMAEQMDELLPAIYHRYDAALAQAAGTEDQPGPLRRFLDLPGGQLDQLYSYARAMLNLYDLDKVDGRLLPLLAQWIGWQTDYRREFDTQRNEIRNAPYIYQTTGIIPTVEATVNRILGWESRTKEFVHNVVLSNQPERLNLWVLQRAGNGTWPGAGELLSLDFAYSGRAAAARASDDTVWLFYHTLQKDRWEIWYKTLTGGPAADGYTWSPSQPLSDGQYLDRHPTAVRHDQIWVFWESYDDRNQTWCIRFRIRGSDGAWSGIETLKFTASRENERRAPVAVTDQDGGLWLFWLEKTDSRWQLYYNRHNGSGWELNIPMRFPFSGGFNPRVEDDIFVLFNPGDVTRPPPLWVFWARKEKLGHTGQTRWQIAYRSKANLDPRHSGWSAIFHLPKGEWVEADDREPTAWINEQGKLELFWSSTRDGSWSIWRTLLSEGIPIPEPVTRTPYSQRAPLPLPHGGAFLLIYRSNESLTYRSTVYTATETLDARYAGCTTVDARNTGKIALRKQFNDFQTYTYETGRNGQRGEQDWYARDTVGIYLTPTTEDPAVISENHRRIKDVLKQFLPIQVRAVFIIELVATEAVYTYDFPDAAETRLIVESAVDSVDTVAAETYTGLFDSRRDTVPGWIWIHSWSSAYPDHRTVDFTQSSIITSFRTWHTGLATGG